MRKGFDTFSIVFSTEPVDNFQPVSSVNEHQKHGVCQPQSHDPCSCFTASSRCPDIEAGTVSKYFTNSAMISVITK